MPFFNPSGIAANYFVNVILIFFTTTLSSETNLTLTAESEIFCPSECICVKPANLLRVDCSDLRLPSLPPITNSEVIILDLSSNYISELPNFAFRHLPLLEDLNLEKNIVKYLPPKVFEGLFHLKVLHLNDNEISHISEGSLSNLQNLQRLWLDGNLLMEIPVVALTKLPHLQALNLAANKIQTVPDYAFKNLTDLVVLILQKNNIKVIEEKAFHGLYSLKVLEINSNKLEKFPVAIKSLPHLRELTFADNKISYLPEDSFKHNPQLTLLEMGQNPIADVEQRTFSNLPNLKELILREAQKLGEFPNLSGTTALEHLRLDRGLLDFVPHRFCTQTPHLKSLVLKSNRLFKLPVLLNCTELRLIDLSYNDIVHLEESAFRKQSKLIDLFLGDNLIERISKNAFAGLNNLHVLDLKNNRIIHIDHDAFLPVSELRDLNLGNNYFSTLPTKGLHNLRQLKTFNNPNLKDFPPPDSFPWIHTLALSYSYHCCIFLAKVHKTTSSPASLQETIVWLSKDEVDMSIWNINITDVWPGYKNLSSKFEKFADDLWKTGTRDYSVPNNMAQYAEEYFEDYKSVYNSKESVLSGYPIQCIPKPDPFMPCEDLFDWWTLRCGVWIVFLLAMLGNGVVVTVLLFGRSKMDVPRFLVCNLAIADFFMGIYLGVLAVVDASTLGEFQVYAIAWQTSLGCPIAGFLGVLSTELSVYTLSVITLERNYAITHTMHLNKRLSLKHAGYIMICGWIFALIMALLPLFGVSDYRKFAVCLPFDTEPMVSLGYVVFLILINGVAFLILMGCYLKMYCAIRGSQAWNSNDSRIAKRMALLVFTDFICWAPIAFFSLTAVSGLNLISLEQAKVFTVFILPLNSCANPFLYAIFTKQFKKDCVLICKRIEESRVTRGIGRCRHSSNFSNRLTPANTNSAVERKSAGSDLPPCYCGAHKVADGARLLDRRSHWKRLAVRYFMCHDQSEEPESNDYTYAIAQIQKKIQYGTKRASSISSENFSSRSDSWRQGNIPLRLLERVGHSNITRKLSQDSCSRQDSTSTSTFRMSRSSVSSDSSNPRPMLSTLRERARPTDTGQSSRPLAGMREKPPITGEPSARLMRGTVNISRDKPRLCRQVAIDETCSQRQTVKGFDIRGIQKSTPFSTLRQDALCPSCSRRDRSPPLTFKSKELEEKFNCFYNRLAETSHEDSSELSNYKDDHVIVSSDQSTGDQKVDSSNTNDTSIPDSSTHEEQSKNDTVQPQIAINQNSTSDKDQDDERGGMYQCLKESCSKNLRQRQGKLHVSTDGVYDPFHLSVSTDNVYNNKSQSMTSIRLNNNLSPSRKVVSDNCLKKLSLKSLPALLRSLSNQNNRKIQKQSAGNHCRMRPSSTSNLQCSNSDVIIHQHSPGYSTELKSSSPRELLRVSHRLDWTPDVYDDNSEVKRGARDQSITQQTAAEVKLTNSIFQPDNSKAVAVNEKVSPAQHKE